VKGLPPTSGIVNDQHANPRFGTLHAGFQRTTIDGSRSHREGEMVTTVAVGAASVLGFLAGLLTLKAKGAWCAVCGVTKECPDPAHRA
jgi:hypothetical protein